MMKDLLPAFVLPEHARVVDAFGDSATFLLTGAETGGRFSMFSNITQPGGGPPPHIHEREDEWFHVIQGSAEFFNGSEWFAVPVGGAVFMPCGSTHTFRNAGDTPLKMIIHTSPSGFEDFFTRCSEEYQREGGPDMAKIIQISAEHGITYPML